MRATRRTAASGAGSGPWSPTKHCLCPRKLTKDRQRRMEWSCDKSLTNWKDLAELLPQLLAIVRNATLQLGADCLPRSCYRTFVKVISHLPSFSYKETNWFLFWWSRKVRRMGSRAMHSGKFIALENNPTRDCSKFSWYPALINEYHLSER